MNIDPIGAQDDQRLWTVFDDRECNGVNGHLYSSVSQSQLTTGVWLHVAMSADATSSHLYINCTEVATYFPDGYNNPGLWFSDMCPGVFTTFIGRSGDDYFKGRIDDVRVFDCALSATEISALCDMGTAIAATEPSASLSVYPNPTRGTVTIIGDYSATTPIDIHDVQGRLAQAPITNRSAGATMLDLSALPSGLYTVRYGGAVQRIVKQD
jgi:hypothetical protein